MSKLHDFAQAVGADIKEIKTALAGKSEKSEVTANGITQDQLNTAIAQAKTELGDRITAIETEDLVSAYNTAKNTL